MSKEGLIPIEHLVATKRWSPNVQWALNPFVEGLILMSSINFHQTPIKVILFQ